MAFELGLKDYEFWDMIPSEFRLYIENRIKSIDEEEMRHHRRTALLSAMIANYSGRSRKKFKVEDFMPKKKITGVEAMLNEVKRMNALMGGDIRRA